MNDQNQRVYMGNDDAGNPIYGEYVGSDAVGNPIFGVFQSLLQHILSFLTPYPV